MQTGIAVEQTDFPSTAESREGIGQQTLIVDRNTLDLQAQLLSSGADTGVGDLLGGDKIGRLGLGGEDYGKGVLGPGGEEDVGGLARQPERVQPARPSLAMPSQTGGGGILQQLWRLAIAGDDAEGLGQAGIQDVRGVILAEIEDAETLLKWGYLDRVVPADRLLSEARRMAMAFAARPPMAAQMVKRSVNAIVSALDQAVMHMDSDQFLLTTKTEDYVKGIAAFTEKRETET